MKTYIEKNSKWLGNYDNAKELFRLNNLDFIIDFKNEKRLIHIADVGCGNGRSIKLIRSIFSNCSILAIDKIKDNCDYVNSTCSSELLEIIHCDAVDFFANDNSTLFDIVLFSWSFFDMLFEEDIDKRTIRFEAFLNDVKKHLNDSGYILIMQPTKGGSFEKLLTLFMPSSDEVYYFTHSFLKTHGFCGPESIVPDKNDRLSIWSSFRYANENDLFDGISSIVYLETGRKLSKKEFNKIIMQFRTENGIGLNESIPLTDCVNIYYWKK